MRTLPFPAAVAIVMLALCGEARAHPLGNFSVNHLTIVTPAPGRVDVRYVLDLAEIPTYALLRDYDPAGRPPAALLAKIARIQAQAVLPHVHVRLDGRALPLVLDSAQASLRRGAGGLPTFYLSAAYHAATNSAGGALPAAFGGNASHSATASAGPSLSIVDDSFAERIGWHDVVLAGSVEPTHGLTVYPPVEAGSPRNVRALRIDDPWTLKAHAVVEGGDTEGAVPAAGANLRSNQLADLLARGTNDPMLVAFALLVALGLGMLHALEPGHGKALMAVSLVGARATWKQAAILAAALTVAHTAAVLLLGLLLQVFKGAFVPEHIYPWIALTSGAVVASVAAFALARSLPHRRAVHAHAAYATEYDGYGYAHERHAHAHERHAHAHDGHAHAHDGHAHAHDGHAHAHDGHAHAHDGHAHAHDGHVRVQAGGSHGHSHVIAGSQPLRFGPAVAAAVSGGIAPCPAALVVLLASLALGQTAYGLAMVLAFSLGLALTLVGLGVGVVRGARLFSGVPAFERYLPYAPLASALAMAAVGTLLAGRGLVDVGAPLPPSAAAILVALTIAAGTFVVRSLSHSGPSALHSAGRIA